MTNEDIRRKEHEAIRNNVGYHDFTHQMLKAEGPDVGAFMDKMFVNNISGAAVGQGKYTSMLNEDGEIIDDVIIFRIEENVFWISTLYIEEMLAWFDKHADGFDVSFENITDHTTMYAVQGPNSGKLLNKILRDNIDDLKFTYIAENYIDDVPVKVARFGFTGELGYELYFTPEHIDMVENKLEEAGQEFDIVKIETDVFLSSLPTEKGLKIMRDYEGLDPYEANLAWSVDWDSDFVGKDAIKASRENGPSRILVGFTVDDDDAEVALKAAILKDGEEVGHVTNYTYGYTIGKNIGFALVDTEKAEIGDPVEIDGVEAVLIKDVFV